MRVLRALEERQPLPKIGYLQLKIWVWNHYSDDKVQDVCLAGESMLNGGEVCYCVFEVKNSSFKVLGGYPTETLSFSGMMS